MIGQETQVLWQGTDVSFLSVHAPESIFGLGKNTGVDQVVVSFADGKETTLSNVDSGRVEAIHPLLVPEID